MGQFPMEMVLFPLKTHLTIKIWPISAKKIKFFCRKWLQFFLLTKIAEIFIGVSPPTVECPVKKSANFTYKKIPKPYFYFDIVYAKTVFYRKNSLQSAIILTFVFLTCSIDRGGHDDVKFRKKF